MYKQQLILVAMAESHAEAAIALKGPAQLSV